MNVNPLKETLQRVLGDDPLRRYTLSWLGIYAGILVVFSGIFFLLVMSHQRIVEEVQSIQSKRNGMVGLTLGRENMAELHKNIKESAALEQTQFIEPSQVPSVISTISNTAHVHAVTVKKINALPNEPIRDFPFIRVPFSLEIEGVYSQVGDFIGALSQSVPWFFSVERIRMTASPPFDGRVSAELRLVFFWRKS